MSDKDLQDLAKSVSESFRRNEMSNVERWLQDNGEYYDKHPNEIIYAHTLVKVVRAIAQDLTDKDN